MFITDHGATLVGSMSITGKVKKGDDYSTIFSSSTAIYADETVDHNSEIEAVDLPGTSEFRQELAGFLGGLGLPHKVVAMVQDTRIDYEVAEGDLAAVEIASLAQGLEAFGR